MSLMVMQSRKCFHRLNDGYFDKKSSNHHLEDSMSKYSAKSVNSYSNCNDSSYGKHRKTYSPNNGSNSRSRSGSPDNWSPNRSVYSNKSYSRSKDRDRDRERERERQYYEKKKSSNCRSRSRSPPDAKQSYKQSVNNHLSHDMNNETKSNANRSNCKTFGDWSEQKSSSGKKYYYNHKTQVSQWEKPKEWQDIDKRHSNKSERHSFRDNRSDKTCVTSSNSKSYEMSSGYRDKDSARNKFSGTASTGSNSNSNSSVRSQPKRDEELKTTTERANNDSKRHTSDGRNSSTNCAKRESLKSPNHTSNESSIQTNSCNKTNFVNNNQTNDVIMTQGISSSNNYNHNNSLSAQQLLNQILSQPLSPSQTQNLQKILSSTPGSVLASADLSLNFSEEALRALQQALQLTVKATDPKNMSQSSQSLRHRVSNSPRNASVIGVNSESPVSTSGHHHRHHHHIPSHHNQHHSHYQTQHPHHNSADGIRQELDQLMNCKPNKSPQSEKSVISSTRHDSPPSSVANMSAISSVSLKPSVPTLTPSLANFFREDLVSHVTGWQADHAEKQANFYSNQSHDIGSHQCTRVSAELKMARSLVRLTEIQSTLQEQRILFATQQIKNVDEWKGGQNGGPNASHTSYHS